MRFPHRLLSLPWLVASLLAAWLVVQPATFAQNPKKDDAKKDEVKKDEPKKDDTKKDDAKKDDQKKEPFQAETDDGVKLVGDFYPPPANVGKNAPVVILLHNVGATKKPGMTNSRKDFDKLPEFLQSKGYGVLAFDFRGHGESSAVNPQNYWRWNTSTVAIGNPPRNKIEPKEFKNSVDFAKFGNDLIAAKKWLNIKNNAMEVNSNNVILVGAEQGALVGALWMAGEFIDINRRKGFGGKPEGEDIACAIWLSMPNRLGTDNVESILKPWMEQLRDKVPTFAVYGELDTNSKAFWERAIKWIKPDKEKVQLAFTGIKTVKKTNLTGTKLLGSEAFGIEDSMVKYLDEVMAKTKAARPWQKQREMEQPTLFAWQKLGFTPRP